MRTLLVLLALAVSVPVPAVETVDITDYGTSLEITSVPPGWTVTRTPTGGYCTEPPKPVERWQVAPRTGYTTRPYYDRAKYVANGTLTKLGDIKVGEPCSVAPVGTGNYHDVAGGIAICVKVQ